MIILSVVVGGWAGIEKLIASEAGTKELSGVIEIFYIFMSVLLTGCTHLPKFNELYT